MMQEAGATAFFPSVSACHLSFFDVPEMMQLKPTRYFYDKHIRPIDATLSLAILNPTIYNPSNIDIHPIRNREFTKGQNTPFGQRQVSYSFAKHRFRGAYYPIRDVRATREKERLKLKLQPIIYRINCLCRKDKLTIEEGRELEELRFKLSPSYKEKVKTDDAQSRKEFQEMLNKAGSSLKSEIVCIAQGTPSINAGAITSSQ
jgi:hypothetical protein